MKYSAIENTCCFTGSRPHNLPFRNENDLHYKSFIAKLEEEIVKAINDGYRHFISGMALGVDTYAANLVLKLRNELPNLNLTLEAAIPCPHQEKLWQPQQQNEYSKILSLCDKQTLVFDTYTSSCYQKRNEYMVDKSSLVIAVFNKHSGGSYNTVKYAKSQNKEIIIINPATLEIL